MADVSLSDLDVSGGRKRRRILIIVAILLIIGAIGGTGGVILYVRRQAPKDAHALYMRGVERLQAKDYNQAFTLFSAALDKVDWYPKYYVMAAKAADLAGRKPEAAKFARESWDRGQRNGAMLSLMIVREGDEAADEKNLADALKLADEIEDQAEQLRTKADLYSEFGKFEEALPLWEQMVAIKPDGEVIERIVDRLIQEKEVDKAFDMLEGFRKSGSLNGGAYSRYIILVNSRNMREGDRSKRVDVLPIFEEAKSRGVYNDRLKFEHAMYHFLYYRWKECGNLLAELREPVTDVLDDRVRHNARLFHSLLLLEQRDAAGLQALAKVATGKRGAHFEGEVVLVGAMQRLLNGEKDIYHDAIKAHKLLLGHPVASLVLAREHIRRKEYDLAHKAYDHIKGLFGTAVFIAAERALLLSNMGKTDEAIKKLVVAHEFFPPTKRSLILLSSLAGKSDNKEFSSALQQALSKLGEKDRDLLSASARLAMRQGDFDHAEQAFKDLGKLDPGSQDAVFGPARVRLMKGDYAGALKMADSIEATPDTVATLRGFALRGLNKHAEAVQQFAEAVKKDKPAAVHLAYGGSLLALGKFKEAEEQFSKVLQAQPKSPAALQGSAFIALQQGRIKEADKHLTELWPLLPTRSAGVHLLRGYTDAGLGKVGSALNHAQKALESEPDNSLALYLKGEQFLRANRIDQGVQVFQELVAKHPSHRTGRRRLAAALLARGDVDGARKHLDQVIQAAPKDLEAQQLLVRALGMAGEHEEAAKNFAAIKSQLPAIQQILTEASLKRFAKDIDGALAVLKQATNQAPVARVYALTLIEAGKSEDPMSVLRQHSYSNQTWIEIGMRAENAKRWKVAKECMDVALNQKPNEATLLNNWAWYAYNMPNPPKEQVLQRIKQAYELQPGHPAVLDTYAEILLGFGMQGEAKTLLTGKMDVISRYPQLMFLLGRAYESAGDWALAKQTYNDCLTKASSQARWTLRTSKEVLQQRLQKVTEEAAKAE